MRVWDYDTCTRILFVIPAAEAVRGTYRAPHGGAVEITAGPSGEAEGLAGKGEKER